MEVYAELLSLFPVATASEIATDVRAASEAYNSERLKLVARAKAVISKDEAERTAAADTAAAVTAHAEDVARLVAELAAMKAAKDFKGMKAAKDALDAAKGTEVEPVVAEVPINYVTGDNLNLLMEEAAKLDDGYNSERHVKCATGFSIGNPSKYDRLAILSLYYSNPYLTDAYRREGERLIEADDYDLAEVYNNAATDAAEYWGLEPGLGDDAGWNYWFPRRNCNEEQWGPLAEEHKESLKVWCVRVCVRVA